MGLDITAIIILDRTKDATSFPKFEVLNEFDANCFKTVDFESYDLNYPSNELKKVYISYLNSISDSKIDEEEVDVRTISLADIKNLILRTKKKIKEAKTKKSVEVIIASNSPSKEIAEDAIENINLYDSMISELKRGLSVLKKFRSFLTFYENIVDRKSDSYFGLKIHCLLDYSY